MKEGLFIKLNWMIYRKTILNNLQLLTQKNPKNAAILVNLQQNERVLDIG